MASSAGRLLPSGVGLLDRALGPRMALAAALAPRGAAPHGGVGQLVLERGERGLGALDRALGVVGAARGVLGRPDAGRASAVGRAALAPAGSGRLLFPTLLSHARVLRPAPLVA